ncbi:hypothetical protein F5X98DRAFT_26721 [Xylaria grammica]|nr:hypothetical protein F5X98DRAFT_26721 [Xylaria grammica]
MMLILMPILMPIVCPAQCKHPNHPQAPVSYVSLPILIQRLLNHLLRGTLTLNCELYLPCDGPHLAILQTQVK